MAKWIWQDYLIVLGLALHFVALFSTIYLNTTIASYSHTNVTTAAQATESNPLQRNLITAYYFQFITGFLVSGVLIAMYLWLRNLSFQKGKRAIEASVYLNTIVLIFFLVNLADASNDLAYLSAIIWK